MILKANAALAELLGTTLDELVGSSMFAYLPAGERKRAEDELVRLITRRSPSHDGVWDVISREGDVVRVRVLATLISGGADDLLVVRVVTP